MDKNDPSLQGVVDILLENQLDFDFVHNGNFDRFDTVIVPAGVRANDVLIEKAEEFLKSGGKLLLVGDALIRDGAHQINTGISSIESSPYDTDFIMSGIEDADLPTSPFLSYIPAPLCRVRDADVYAELYPPMFNRTYGSFCGHRNTPYVKNGAKYPALTKRQNVVFMAHDIGALYNAYGTLSYKQYFIEALTKVLGYEPILKTSFGSSGRVTMIHQKDKKRYAINLTYAAPVRRGMAEIIDEITPIYDVNVELSIPESVSRVFVPLSGKALDFKVDNGKVSFSLSRLLCHESIIIEY
jgi:hypothetical protein